MKGCSLDLNSLRDVLLESNLKPFTRFRFRAMFIGQLVVSVHTLISSSPLNEETGSVARNLLRELADETTKLAGDCEELTHKKKKGDVHDGESSV